MKTPRLVAYIENLGVFEDRWHSLLRWSGFSRDGWVENSRPMHEVYAPQGALAFLIRLFQGWFFPRLDLPRLDAV